MSNLTVIVKAPASGFLTNVAGVSTTTLDTNSVNNTSPPVISRVTTLALSADVGVIKAGPANVFAGTNYSYTKMCIRDRFSVCRSLCPKPDHQRDAGERQRTNSCSTFERQQGGEPDQYGSGCGIDLHDQCPERRNDEHHRYDFD